MKKILFLTSNFPRPLDSGGKLRDYHIMRYLARTHELSVAGFHEVKFKNESERCLPFVPRERCHILDNLKDPKEYLDFPSFIRYRYLPKWCLSYFSFELQNLLDNILSRDRFDYIHISHSYMAHYALEYAGVTRVLDHHNVKTAFYKEAAARTRNPLKKMDYLTEHYKWYKYEREVLDQFDVHTSCAESEREAIRSFVSAPVELLPSGVDTDYFHPKQEESTGSNLIFTGTLEYFPNHEAVLYFCKEIFPAVLKDVPRASFHVVGRKPAPSLERLFKSNPRCWLTSDVADMRPFFYQSTIFVVPLLNGAGTRLKIMEAMAAGLPVVSTSKGAEGLGLKNGEGILIADDPNEFSYMVIGLLRDRGKREELRQKAIAISRERFSWKKVLTVLDRIYR